MPASSAWSKGRSAPRRRCLGSSIALRWCSSRSRCVIAAVAWFFTGDPVRAVAVLVIATPCPLILAVPVAIVSGPSRAAGHGILIKGGTAIEALARINSLVLDKTGTLTDGRAKVVAVNVSANVDPDDVLRLAASLDQASSTVLAQTIVAEAQSRQLKLTIPSDVVETPGEGVQGVVEGRSVAVGGIRFVMSNWRTQRRLPSTPSRGAAPPSLPLQSTAVWRAG